MQFIIYIFRMNFNIFFLQSSTQMKLARNPKTCLVDDLPYDIQEKYINFINNTQVQDEFKINQEMNNHISEL